METKPSEILEVRPVTRPVEAPVPRPIIPPEEPKEDIPEIFDVVEHMPLFGDCTLV